MCLLHFFPSSITQENNDSVSTTTSRFDSFIILILLCNSINPQFLFCVLCWLRGIHTLQVYSFHHHYFATKLQSGHHNHSHTDETKISGFDRFSPVDGQPWSSAMGKSIVYNNTIYSWEEPLL